ncbi:hypothetical protein PQR66_08980 [Paraburkholderia agricolaris]|uniref:Chitinase n=1 Tax=Paraburkholderia agricolaris TaxID=2152888 RepID=A0ABW8ZLW8_9BURK
MSEASDAGISSPKELANFMGQMQVESAGFTHMDESLNYSGSRLFELFHKRLGLQDQVEAAALAAKGPEAVANAVYGGRYGVEHLGNTEPGDGWRFHGRGFVQLTGRHNYEVFGKALGIDLVHHPELAAEPKIAARIAVKYWADEVVNHQLKHGHVRHDQLDVVRTTHDINGGENGLSVREAAVDVWVKKLAADGIFELGEKTGKATPALRDSLDSDQIRDGARRPNHGLEGLGLSDPRNPDHALYQQAYEAATRLDAERGRKPDNYTEQLAGSAVVAAKQEGLTRIDHLVFSDDGNRTFVVDGALNSPLKQVAFMDTTQAVNASLTSSSELVATTRSAPVVQVAAGAVAASSVPQPSQESPVVR